MPPFVSNKCPQNVKLPLKRARNGHLLLDLIQDWLGDVKSIHLASDPATASNDFPDMPREQYKAADQSICGDQHTFLPSPCHGIREVDPHAHSSFAGDSKVSQVVSADSRCVCEEDMEKELMSEQCHEQQFGNERMQSANPNADFTTGSSMRLFPALVAAAISSTSSSTRHVLKPNRPYPRMRRPKLPWPSRRPSRNPRALATEHRRPRSTIGLECKAQIPEILGARDTPAGAHWAVATVTVDGKFAKCADWGINIYASSRCQSNLQVGWSSGNRYCPSHGQGEGECGEGIEPREPEHQGHWNSGCQGIPAGRAHQTSSNCTAFVSSIGAAAERTCQAY